VAYALISPVRNEELTLGWLASSLSNQSVQPAKWVIVDDHSTDSTWQMAQAIADLLPWAMAVRSPRPPVGALGEGAGFGRDVAAFEAGVNVLGHTPNFVGKLDGDLALDANYYECLLEAFDEDPRLGITGGVCWEEGPTGWGPVQVAADHVRGAARLYRWDCWVEVSPLPQRIGWDGIDLVRARLAGWNVRSCETRFFHERPVGARG
jgi:glycosyltransferase involved in cell wall biosynthesis